MVLSLSLSMSVTVTAMAEVGAGGNSGGGGERNKIVGDEVCDDGSDVAELGHTRHVIDSLKTAKSTNALINISVMEWH